MNTDDLTAIIAFVTRLLSGGDPVLTDRLYKERMVE